MTFLLIFAAFSVMATLLAAALTRGGRIDTDAHTPENPQPSANNVAEQDGRRHEQRGQVRARHRPTAAPRRKFR